MPDVTDINPCLFHRIDGGGLTVSIFDKLYKNLELYNNILSIIAQSLKVQVIRESCEGKHHARFD